MHLVHEIVVWASLVASATLVFLCAVGVMVMRDAYQRLHFIAPPATLGALLVVVACVVDEPRPAAWLKAIVVMIVLGAMNAVVTHATARAAFVREWGAWPPPERAPIRRMKREDT